MEIFVESPIIAHRREYPGTRPLKSIPTRSHQKGYFENTSLYMFRQRKRCYDVTLSRQEGSTTRHLASAHHWAGLAGGDTGRLFLTFGGPVRADRISYCPLDRVLTYKNLIYLLNLQVWPLLSTHSEGSSKPISSHKHIRPDFCFP